MENAIPREILERWQQLRATLALALVQYKDAAVNTPPDGVDIPDQVIADCERQIVEFDMLLERYGRYVYLIKTYWLPPSL
jgi:hypothetical protein